MDDSILIPAGYAAAGGGIASLVAVILRFASGKNSLNQKQIDGFIGHQGARIDALEKLLAAETVARQADNAECSRQLMAMQRTVGGLEAMIDRTRIGVVTANIVADSDGIITEWNDAATSLFGWSRAEAVGQNVSIIVPLRLRGDHDTAFAAASSEKRAPSDKAAARMRESHAMCKDGSEMPVTIILRGWEHGGSWFYSAEIRRR